MRYFFILVTAVFLQGCEPPRNNPTHQAEDYATCKKAGMDAYLNSIDRVKCKPPKSVVTE